jgi:hypothetical protein
MFLVHQDIGIKVLHIDNIAKGFGSVDLLYETNVLV